MIGDKEFQNTKTTLSDSYVQLILQCWRISRTSWRDCSIGGPILALEQGESE